MADQGNRPEDAKLRRPPPAKGLVEYLSHLNGVVQLIITVIAGLGIAWGTYVTGGFEHIESLFANSDVEGTLFTPVPTASTAVATSPVVLNSSLTTEAQEPTLAAETPPTAAVSVASGVTMEVVSTEDLPPGQGQLSLSFAGTDYSIDDLYVKVYASKLDARQQPTIGEQVATDYTDSGLVIFDLPPGEYIVLADLDGYNWGTLETDEGMANVVVQSGHTTILSVRLGRLVVTTTSVDEAISDQYVKVYTQTSDVNGNMVTGDRVATGYTDNTGSLSLDLTKGEYIVVTDFEGYSWGDAFGVNGEAGVAVTAGEETVVVVSLGQVLAAVRDAEGNAAEGVYLKIHTQIADALGKAVPGDRVTAGYTDNTGTWRADLTPGTYCIVIGEEPTCDVEVGEATVAQLELNEP